MPERRSLALVRSATIVFVPRTPTPRGGWSAGGTARPPQTEKGRGYVARHDSSSATPEDERRPVQARRSAPVGRTGPVGRGEQVRRAGIAGWPIRRKLVALVALPLVVILAAGGVLAVQTTRDYLDSRDTRQLAELAASAVDVTGAVTQEYARSTSVIGAPEARKGSPLYDSRLRTDATVTKLLKQVTQLTPSNLSAESDLSGQQLNQLPGRVRALRTGVQKSFNVAQVAGGYSTILDLLATYLRAISGDIGQSSASQNELNAAQTQNNMVQVSVAAARERSLFAQSLQEDKLSLEANFELQTLIATQNQNLDAAALVATTQQRGPLDQLRAGDPQLTEFRGDAVALLTAAATPGNKVATTVAGDANVYEQVAQRRLDQILALTGQVSQSLRDSAAATERTNLFRAIGVTALSLLTLLVVGLLVARLARSISVPLRLLRVGAGDAAHVNLPNAVAEIERNGPDAVVGLPAVLPPGTSAGPETMDVARAVDNLGAEAVRLAASQVRLRRTLDDAFVSMSRRSQSMVEKQLAIIDELESTEEDPDQLRNLFRLDHLAARMRRYNDNLLVLAGSTMRNRTTAPVRVAELFRAATSEMEQYERVRLQPVGGAAVAGTVAGELIHLLAELLDNAAMYSPPSSSIVLSAAFTSDGGLHLEVVDSGVGIPSDEIDRLNTRLARSETMDLQAASRIGLFVVARLARRGGFMVSLRQRPDANGTVAQVVVPPPVVIGAPGSTGEQPVLGTLAPLPSSAWAGPRTGPIPTIMPPAGVPTQPVDPDRLPALPAAASATSASDAAAAGLWSPPGRAADQAAAEPAPLRGTNDPLPRRRRGASAAGNPPPELAAAGTAESLFGPAGDEPAVARNGLPSAANAFRHERPAPIGQPGPGADPGADPGPVAGSATSSATSSAAGGAAGGGANGLPRRSGAAAALSAATGWPDDPTAALPRVDPLTDSSGSIGELKSRSNSSVPSGSQTGSQQWEELLPTELAARAAAASAYQPADPDNPLIGTAPDSVMPGGTPIFDSISAWFGDDAGSAEVIDVRDGEQPAGVSRWDSLGDQRWLATSARAAADPDVAGHTTTGLPKRRPGANLLPSASTANAAPSDAPVAAPGPSHRAAAPTGPIADRPVLGDRDAAAIRGRLGNYQRGLASARRSRPEPTDDEFGAFDPVGATLFAAGKGESAEGDNGQQAAEQGGDS
jgi:signal transduction histidine kinase